MRSTSKQFRRRLVGLNHCVRLACAVVAANLPIGPASLHARPTEIISDPAPINNQCAAVDRDPKSTFEAIYSCRLERIESDKLLWEHAMHDVVDPELEARRSADAGDFRFMGYSMLVPGTFPAAYSVSCKPSIVSQGTRMVRALYLASDVPPITEDEGKSRELEKVRHRAFGERYNLALLGDPRSPYRKICVPSSRAGETEGGPFRKD